MFYHLSLSSKGLFLLILVALPGFSWCSYYFAHYSEPKRLTETLELHFRGLGIHSRNAGTPINGTQCKRSSLTGSRLEPKVMFLENTKSGFRITDFYEYQSLVCELLKKMESRKIALDESSKTELLHSEKLMFDNRKFFRALCKIKRPAPCLKTKGTAVEAPLEFNFKTNPCGAFSLEAPRALQPLLVLKASESSALEYSLYEVIIDDVDKFEKEVFTLRYSELRKYIDQESSQIIPIKILLPLVYKLFRNLVSFSSARAGPSTKHWWRNIQIIITRDKEQPDYGHVNLVMKPYGIIDCEKPYEALYWTVDFIALICQDFLSASHFKYSVRDSSEDFKARLKSLSNVYSKIEPMRVIREIFDYCVENTFDSFDTYFIEDFVLKFEGEFATMSNDVFNETENFTDYLEKGQSISIKNLKSVLQP